MSSIVTNSAAMTALQSLTATMKSMETTQARISTGLRVNSAADNAAYWSIATTMRSDSAALSAVTDALNLGSSTIDVASNGLKSAIDVTSQIKAKLTAALQGGVDRKAIQSDITQLQKQLKSIGDSASFSGQNWISIDSSANGSNTIKSIVSSFQNGTVSTIDIDAKTIALFDSNSSASQAVYNVSFDAASGSDLETDVAALFSSPADGDTANVTLNINGGDQAATVTHNSGTYTISYKSSELVDSSSTEAAATKVKVSGSSNAANDVDFTGSGVVTQTNDFSNSGGYGVLSKIGSHSGIAIAQFDASGALTNSIDISNKSDSVADVGDIKNYIKDVDAAITSMTTAGANLGSVKSRVSLQQSFVTSLLNSIDKGIASLVDADMNQESTRLQALQVQQQLGVQALSIANQSSQTILSLFRG